MRPVIMLAGGSASLGDGVYLRAARDFGRRLAREGWILRTGGGKGDCIMGAAADGALEEGGTVQGVILQKFWKIRHRGLHSMRAYGTFALRKAALIRGAVGAVILPGGYGTLDELGDLLTLHQTGLIQMPIVVLDTAGYYAGLLAWDRRAQKAGFLYGGRLFHVARTPRHAIRLLGSLLQGGNPRNPLRSDD